MRELGPFETKEAYTFDDLLRIMVRLRAKAGGCPWDIEQTHQSIRNNLIEETYEAVEGIDASDNGILKEELGDVLLQVVFHARIAEEEGAFDIDDVADGICKKLILRHPHIFGSVEASTAEEVLKNWDEIKKEEKQQKSASDTLRGVSAALPALARTSKLQSKAEKAGAPKSDAAHALDAVAADVEGLRAVLRDGTPDAVLAAAGRLLFSTAGAVRLAGANPEEALYHCNADFVEHFARTESAVRRDGKQICELSVNDFDDYWEKTKKN